MVATEQLSALTVDSSIPEAQKAMEKVKSAVFQQRIRLKEFFVDFDRLRSGLITQAQFKSGLSAAGISLTAHELDELTHHWRDTQDETERVRYVAFVDEVNATFGPSRLELSPTGSTKATQPSLLRNNRFKQMPPKQLDEHKEELVHNALDDIAHHVSTHRVQVKPFFDDAAKSRRRPRSVNRVTRPSFSQVLLTHVAPPGLTSEHVEALADKFEDEPGMVNYLAFTYEIDAN